MSFLAGRHRLREQREKVKGNPPSPCSQVHPYHGQALHISMENGGPKLFGMEGSRLATGQQAVPSPV